MTVTEVLARAGNSWDQLPKWISDAYENGEILFGGNAVHILTLEGRMTAQQGDFIIQGVAGEIYPCKPDIFEATYEAVA